MICVVGIIYMLGAAPQSNLKTSKYAYPLLNTLSLTFTINDIFAFKGQLNFFFR